MNEISTTVLKEAMTVLNRNALKDTTGYEDRSDHLTVEAFRKSAHSQMFLQMKRHGVCLDLRLEIEESGDNNDIPFKPVRIDDLKKLISLLPKNETVSINAKRDDGDQYGELVVTQGKRTYGLAGIGAKDVEYGEPLGDRVIGLFQSYKMLATLKRAMPFMSEDVTRPVINGVKLTMNDGTCELTATDSYRILEESLDFEIEPEYAAGAEVILRRGDAKILMALLQSGSVSGSVLVQDVTQKLADHQAEKERPQIAFSGISSGWKWTFNVFPCIGEYPKSKEITERIKGNLVDSWRVVRGELDEIARSAMRHLDNGELKSRRLNLEFTGDTLIVTGESDAGTFEETMKASCSDLSSDTSVGVNGYYLQNALHAYSYLSALGHIEFLMPLRTYSDDYETGQKQINEAFMIGPDVVQMPMRHPS